MVKIETPSKSWYYPRGAENWFDKTKYIKIFLAGTIDNGFSNNWQDKLIQELCYFNRDEFDDRDFGEDWTIGNVLVFNPRRDDWKKDATTSDVEEQIKWEQEKLDEADLIVMYLDDNSKSPISLLELGLYGPNGKMIVFCTENFYRASNVKLTCFKYNIPLYQTTDIKNVVKEIDKIYQELNHIDS